MSFGERRHVDAIIDNRNRAEKASTDVEQIRYQSLLGNESFDEDDLTTNLMRRLRMTEKESEDEAANFETEDQQNEEESLFDRI